VVALSSYEAKYIAATIAMCQGIWLARLLAEFKGGGRSQTIHSKDRQSVSYATEQKLGLS
jgi:hypothetical protein